jgi:hypothetical protein
LLRSPLAHDAILPETPAPGERPGSRGWKTVDPTRRALEAAFGSGSDSDSGSEKRSYPGGTFATLELETLEAGMALARRWLQDGIGEAESQVAGGQPRPCPLCAKRCLPRSDGQEL